jgi:hypothetical protein
MFFGELGGTAQQAADAVRAFWASLASTLGNGVSAQVESDVAHIDENDGSLTGASATTTTAVAFTSSGEPLPFATQGLIRWTTGVVVNGRFLKGKTFVPAFTETNSTGGAPTAATLSSMSTAAQNLMADANSTLVVWHRETAPGAGDGEAVFVTGHTEWAKWAVLRSRRD